MKFDFCIGNPPYQEEIENNGRQSPVYNYFMDAAYEIADCTELITPGRFLFDAGQTPKAWNQKMLNDKHFGVLQYEPDGSLIFPNTDIKGGVAITFYNKKKTYIPIRIFTHFSELNSILQKVTPNIDKSIATISIGAVPYRFSDTLRKEHPELVELIGSSFDFRTNILDKLENKLFFGEKTEEDDIQILGLHKKNREFMWIRSKYILSPKNFPKYKVFLPKSNGSGALGEVLSTPLVGQPLVGHTQSFISIGSFETKQEADACYKYICTKFARCMLGVLKVTQDNPPDKWKYVPLQNFTDKSDIDWSASIPNIDRQLYKKYGLSPEEIEFIETHVKEME